MKRYGLIGEHLEYSYSPLIHSKFGDYEYDICECEPDGLKDMLADKDYDGFNITIPYKETVMEYCDEITNDSRKIGAVNVILRDENGKLCGHNTDYFGFRNLMENNRIDPAGRKCLILGSGGASHTVRVVLEDLGAAEIVVISRRGEDNYENLDKHRDAQIMINTTPVGMYPRTMRSPVRLKDFPELMGLVDLIYNPYRTSLILEAMSLGIPCAGGLRMLVAQAWQTASLFMGEEIDSDEIDSVYEEVKSETLNSILIGMPGAGKTFLGKKMAERKEFRFLDIDDMIEEEEGKTVSEIFQEKGEPYFRKLETRMLERACKETAVIIATGGGVVKTKENYNIMRQNGNVIWIKRDLDKLDTGGRPLSSSTGIEKLYEERKDLYESWSDYYIDNNQEMK